MNKRDIEQMVSRELGREMTVLDADSPLTTEMLDHKLGDLWATGAELLSMSKANQTDANLWAAREAMRVFDRAKEYAEGKPLLAYALTIMVCLDVGMSVIGALMQAEHIARMREELGDE